MNAPLTAFRRASGLLFGAPVWVIVSVGRDRPRVEVRVMANDQPFYAPGRKPAPAPSARRFPSRVVAEVEAVALLAWFEEQGWSAD